MEICKPHALDNRGQGLVCLCDEATKSFVCCCAFLVSFVSKRESLGVGVLYVWKLRDWNPNIKANELHFELSMSVFHQRETYGTHNDKNNKVPSFSEKY